MAAFKTAVVQGFLNKTGSVDIISEGFGEVKGAMIYYGSHPSSELPNIIGTWVRASVGMIDSANRQNAYGFAESSAQTTTNCARAQTTSGVVVAPNDAGSAKICEYSGALIPDGIRFTMITDTMTSAQHVVVHLFGGDELLTHVGSNVSMSARSYTGIGFTPNVAFAANVGNNAAWTTNFSMSLGVIVDHAGQKAEYVTVIASDDANSGAEYYGVQMNYGFSVQHNITLAGMTWRCTHSSFSNGRHDWVTIGTVGTDTGGFLYMFVPDNEVKVQGTSVPITTGISTLAESSGFIDNISSYFGSFLYDVTAWNLESNVNTAVFGWNQIVSDTTNTHNQVAFGQNLARPTIIGNGWFEGVRLLDNAASEVVTGDSLIGGNRISWSLSAANGVPAVGWVVMFGGEGALDGRIALGSNPPKFYLGWNNVEAIYLGDKQVYKAPAGSNEPPPPPDLPKNIVTSGLVQWIQTSDELCWDGFSGTAKDLVGSYDASFIGGIPVRKQKGWAHCADCLSGVHYLDFNNSAFASQLPSAFTIEVVRNYASSGYVITRGNANKGLWFNSSANSMTIGGIADYTFTGSSSPSGRLNIECYVVNGTSAKRFIDGVLVSTITISTTRTASTQPIVMDAFVETTGVVGSPGAQEFYDFKYYNRALSDAEVLANFDAQKEWYGL